MPCRRGVRRVFATDGHAGSRSWQRLEADHVEHRVAEEPGAAGAHARGDLDGGEWRDGLELRAPRLGDHDVHEPALGEWPARSEERRVGEEWSALGVRT